jgi:hypothetical protein
VAAPGNLSLSEIAFHENAVYVKTECANFVVVVAFVFAFLTIHLSFLAEHFAERPGAVKGACFCGAANP